MDKFDYAIIGQGSAAFAAAIKANELGIKTVMIGRNETDGAVLGGTCINVGCVPSKRLITVAKFINELKERRFKGVSYEIGKVKYEEIAAETKDIVKHLRKQKYEEVLHGLENVEYINEFGSIAGKGRDYIELGAGRRSIAAKKVLMATGARASVPKIEGVEKVKYITNEEALFLDKLPESIMVVGGRALGLEFAQLFARLGVKVTLLQRSSTIIPEHEPQIAALLQKYLSGEGINIKTNVVPSRISEYNGVKRIETADGKYFEADEILFATGRKPNIEKLNCEKVGLRLENGFIFTNEFMETNVNGIYAAGDITGEPMLEALAAKEGTVATINAFTNAKAKISKNEIPKAIFTDPEVATVGLTDAEAHGKGFKCACNTLPLSLVPKASIIGDTRGAVKIVIDYKTHKILGMHILAPNAADIIHEGVLAVKFGLTIDDIIDTVHVFPTLSESIKLAAQSFYADVSKMSCCT
ncbi:MAG: mercury(II) reductase [Candidatus Micrarchaeia archaeon]